MSKRGLVKLVAGVFALVCAEEMTVSCRRFEPMPSSSESRTPDAVAAPRPLGSGAAAPFDEFAAAREQMVNDQIARRDVADQRVLSAMRRVPRHEFVALADWDEAYDDHPLGIGSGQTISQPYIVAKMTELARLTPQSRVLEVGTGSGYQAAVLAEIAAQVYSIEIVEALAKQAADRLARMGYENVQVRCGDGYEGWPDAAPFDAILVTAAPPSVPEPLRRQLVVGGRLVIPVGEHYQELKVIIRTETGWRETSELPVRFVPMTGKIQRR